MFTQTKRTLLRSLALSVLAVLLGVSGALAETVTLRFLHRGGGDREAVVKAWIEAFEAKNPDIKVEWQPATGPWQDQLLVSIAAGTAPDITEAWGNLLQQLAHQGALLNLDPYVERHMTAEEVSDFFPSTWNVTTFQFGPNQGARFAMPRYINTMIFYYNKAIFAEAGLENPGELDARNAWTWESLRESARRTTRWNGDENTQLGFSTRIDDWIRVAQWAWGAGGDWFDRNDARRFIGDQPEAIQGISFVQDMIWTDQTASADFFGSRTRFYAGNVAMFDEGIHAVFAARTAIADSFEFDIATRPVGPNGRAPLVVDDSLAVLAGTQHPDAAWRFLHFLTSTEGQEIMVRVQGLAPVRRSAAEAYFGLDGRLSLDVFARSAFEGQPLITTRVDGDTDQIGRAIREALLESLDRNEKPFAQAIREVRGAVEAAVSNR